MKEFIITEDFPKSEIEFDMRFSDPTACYDYLFSSSHLFLPNINPNWIVIIGTKNDQIMKIYSFKLVSFSNNQIAQNEINVRTIPVIKLYLIVI